jgi:hypothetical protein
MYLHDLPNAIDAAIGATIAQEIEIEFVVKSSIDGVMGAQDRSSLAPQITSRQRAPAPRSLPHAADDQMVR